MAFKNPEELECETAELLAKLFITTDSRCARGLGSCQCDSQL